MFVCNCAANNDRTWLPLCAHRLGRRCSTCGTHFHSKQQRDADREKNSPFFFISFRWLSLPRQMGEHLCSGAANAAAVHVVDRPLLWMPKPKPNQCFASASAVNQSEPQSYWMCKCANNEILTRKTSIALCVSKLIALRLTGFLRQHLMNRKTIKN